jgi:Subtilase family
VSTYNGATDVSQVLAAIDWVVQHRTSGGLNIRVLNLSFGTDSVQDYRLDPLTYAAEVAWRAGIVVVAAGGNEGFGNARLNDPAYDPFIIAVGADDPRGTPGSGNDLVPDFSARGESRSVDFVAPGRSVISLRAAGSYIDTNHPEGRVGDRFFRGSGTSQAAAVTSGVAALLLQQRPELTPDQVKYILRGSAAPLPSETSVAKGQGLVSISRAMNYATPTAAVAAQAWDAATGLGSLEASRGSQRLTDNGVELKGEHDIFGNTFDTAKWAPMSASGSSWTGGDWMGSSWTGSSWTGSSWTGSSWTGSSWTGSSWTGSSWTGSSWTGSSWTGSSWTGSSWTGSSWTGSSWTGSSWTGSSWTGQFWSGSGWGP